MLTELDRTRGAGRSKHDVPTLVSLINSGAFEQTKEDVANTLRTLATELDKRQRDMDIAKISCASVGIVGTAMAIGGVIAAPILT